MPNDLPEDINLENIVFFDVCLTCDDEKLTKVSNDIWDKYLATEFKVSGRGKKPTTPYKRQFETLFINLLLNFHDSLEKLIAIPMGKSVYAKSRYNSLHLTERFPDIVRKAEKVGLIERTVGIYTPNAKKLTRIWPTPLLEAELEKCEIDTSKVLRIEQTSNKRREVIILNRKDETSDKSVPVDYEDTEESNKLREDVRFY
ncbi:MAG: hypothetical protein HOI01_01830, partial [Proteobacteria bacterium]|nr:hypothetical protein [Pseudomonadota bacterium]